MDASAVGSSPTRDLTLLQYEGVESNILSLNPFQPYLKRSVSPSAARKLSCSLLHQQGGGLQSAID